MRSTLDRVNVVHIRLHVLGELSAVLHCDFVLRTFFFTHNSNDVSVQRITRTIQVFYKFNQSAFILKVATFTIAFIVVFDVDTAVEESEFLQAFVEGVKVVLGDTENFVISFERRFGTSLFGHSTLAYRTGGYTTLIFLSPSEAITTYLSLSPLAQEVHNGNTNTVQTAGGLIGTFFKFSTKFQHGHHAFKRADLTVQFFRQLLVSGDRDPTPIVFNCHTTVSVHGHRHHFGEISHRLINGIIDHLIHQVVQSSTGSITDIHTRPLTHMLEVRQMLQVSIGIIRVSGWNGRSRSFVGGRTRLRSVAHEDLQKRG